MEKENFNRTLSFNVGIAKETSIEAAILFDELSFLSSRGKRDDGWVYKTYAEMQERIMLSEYQIRKAYKILTEKGYIVTKLMRANGAPTIHFKVTRFLRMDSEKTSESNSEKTSESITATHTATHINTDPAVSQQVQAVYELYLKRIIIPSRLKDKINDTPADVLLKMAASRYKLTPERRNKIVARLKDAKYNMVCAAIVGYSKEPWYIGENERGWYAKLAEFICRNYDKVEEGAGKYEAHKLSKNQNDPWA